MDLSQAVTESSNPASQHLDRLSSLEIVRLMNAEDGGVVEAVARVSPAVAEVVDAVVLRLADGGRLFYVGAGTSGRLGVLDASECPPTFGTSPEMVQGIIAGGPAALSRSVEEAEDDPGAGAAELDSRNVASGDFVVGISASGRTPFVLGALARARQIGAGSAAIFCNPGCPLADASDHPLLLEVGPEVLAGSTRLKAGTATKMVLNQISTAVMVRLGRCLGNMMVDLNPACQKLRDRSVRILAQAGGVGEERARAVLEEAGGDLRLASVMAAGGLDLERARAVLDDSSSLSQAVERARMEAP